jgi:hypothetical protein
MENELCRCVTIFLSHDVIPPIESPDSNAAPGIGLKVTLRPPFLLDEIPESKVDRFGCKVVSEKPCGCPLPGIPVSEVPPGEGFHSRMAEEQGKESVNEKTDVIVYSTRQRMSLYEFDQTSSYA